MGMMDRIYGEEYSNQKAMSGMAGCVASAPMPSPNKDSDEPQRSSIADQVVSRVKSARKEEQNMYLLQRFAELGDRNPEVMEMLEIARDLNLV